MQPIDDKPKPKIKQKEKRKGAGRVPSQLITGITLVILIFLAAIFLLLRNIPRTPQFVTPTLAIKVATLSTATVATTISISVNAPLASLRPFPTSTVIYSESPTFTTIIATHTPTHSRTPNPLTPTYTPTLVPSPGLSPTRSVTPLG
ncbi:MAG: hypothetical protein ABI947_29180 [Chloroflexota bacterium]